MNQPGVLIKAAVIASSLLLAGGFICYKAGALNGLLASDAPNADGSVAGRMEPLAMPVPAAPDTPGIPRPDTAGKRPQVRKGATDTIERERHFFSGSKSGMRIIEVPADTPAAAPSDTSASVPADSSPRREVFMGGSKSIAPLIDPPGPELQSRDSSKPVKRKR